MAWLRTARWMAAALALALAACGDEVATSSEPVATEGAAGQTGDGAPVTETPAAEPEAPAPTPGPQTGDPYPGDPQAGDMPSDDAPAAEAKPDAGAEPARPQPPRRREDAEETSSPRPPPPPTTESGPSRGIGGGGSAGVALPDGFETVSNVLLPAESYLPKGDGMPTGVVLLSASERSKNRRLCDALLGRRTATIETEAAARARNPDGDFLVTHWLSRSRVADEGDCDELLAKYDFDRSGRIRSGYGLDASKGPIFLALDPTGEIVFLDLEAASPDEVYTATANWMKLALKSPQLVAGEPPRPRGLLASANTLFARLAGGFASLAAADRAPRTVRFNDPVQGTARTFTLYRSGVFLIGATFLL